MKQKNTPLRVAIQKRGWSLRDLLDKGIPYGTLVSHYYGNKTPSGDYALKYEKFLGIPRQEIRPDLWPQEDSHDLSTFV